MVAIRLNRCLALWAVVLLLLGLAWPVGAEETTLARLSFWVPPERMDEFEEVYTTQIVPLLKQYGMVESGQRGRTTVDSVFSRLFEFETPIDVLRQEWEWLIDESSNSAF